MKKIFFLLLLTGGLLYFHPAWKNYECEVIVFTDAHRVTEVEADSLRREHNLLID